jgi:hypothetical protein
MAKRYYVVASMPGGRSPMERSAKSPRDALKLGVKLARYFGDRAVVRERDSNAQTDEAVAVCYAQKKESDRRRMIVCVPATGRGQKLTTFVKKKRRR